MPVSDDVASQVADQLGDWDPKKTSKYSSKEGTPLPAHAARGETFDQASGRAADEVMAMGARGVAGGLDFAKGAAVGTLLPTGIIPEYKVKNGEVVRPPGGKVVQDILMPSSDTLSKEHRDAAEHPRTTVGKVFGPMAEGAGRMLSMPMLPEAPEIAAAAKTSQLVKDVVSRNLISGGGMGEGQEIGKYVFGGLSDYFFGDRHSGEQFGEIVGSGLGGQANVTRVNAMGAAAKSAFGSAYAVVPAVKATIAAKKIGDERDVHKIFMDEFSNVKKGALGLIQDYTNRQLADAIRRDIYASKSAESFVHDSEVTGMNDPELARPWGLPERVMTPALTTISAERTGRTMQESSQMSEQAAGRQQAIKKVYDNLENKVALPATPGGIEASAKMFKEITQSKVDALTKQVGQVQQNFPEIHVTKGYEAGEQARTIRDTLADQAFAEASAKYRAAETMADTEGVVIPSGGIRNEAGAILEEFYGKVDPSAIPAEVKSVLTATRGVKGPEVETPGHIGGFVEAKEAEATASKGKDLSLKEANNVVVALGKAETKARGQQNWTAADNARALKDKMLKSIEDSKMSPAAKAAYIDARDNYRTNYAQRFQEGMGKQLGKEQGQGSAVAGREALVGNKVLGTALIDENNMREWDKVYGNNPEARALMSAELESRFRKTLADSRTPDALERQLKAFKDKYDFALARYPQVADKMEKGGAAQMRLQLQRKAELERYEFIMSGDITKAVGPVQAKIMFEKALADPDKMRALIAAFPEGGGGAAKRLTKELFLQANPFRSGEYDQDALYKMLNAGRKDQFSPSTLQLLFDSAFGKEAGAKHLHVLEAIGRFTEREAAVNPVNLRPQSLISDAPVSQGSGSTMASHLSNLRNMETGRSGSTFVATLSLSRLVNTKVQQAVEAAKIKALYDPETAEAVLALAATPINKPVAYGMMKLVLGGIKLENGTSLLDHMVDKGYVKKYVSRGIIAGIETASEDEDKRSTAVRR